MVVRISEITQALETHGIEFILLANESTLLSGPVDWQAFNGEGLAFYVGNDTQQLSRWNDSIKCLIICSISQQYNLNAHGPFLLVENPRLAFVVAAELFVERSLPQLHPSAVIDPCATIGEDVFIGPLSFVGAAEIGNGTKIGSMVSITSHVCIGKSVVIMNGVHIGEPGPGSVVDLEGNLKLFPHFEKARIEDNVVIGSGTVINRGVLRTTVIGENTHISANCTIGHNCQIGKNVFIAFGVLIGGSACVGDHCFLGMGACLRDGVNLAEDITIGMNSTISSSYSEPGITLVTPPPINIGKMFGWQEN